MSITNDPADSNVWPMPKFYFEVNFDENFGVAQFQEVSGLDTETQALEYRTGNNPTFETVKMPGIAHYGNVTLKKGVFQKNNHFWDWHNNIKMNTIKRTTVTIKLLDESGAATMEWILSNAWPTKVTGTDLKADGNEVAIETIELAHEGIKMENS